MKKKNLINSELKNKLSNQKGFALLATLIFTFILATLGVALLTMTSNDSKLSTLQRESNRAFYLAETGVEQTFYNLNVVNDETYGMLTWRPGDTNPIFSVGNAEEYFEVTITNIGGTTPPEEETDRIKIISTGVVNKGKYSSGKRKIEVTAAIDYITEAMYKYAILADKIILFHGTPGPDITGDIHSNDAIEVTGNQFVDNYEGIATCSGDNNDVNSENTNFAPVPIPGVIYSDLYASAVDEGEAIHVHNGYELQNSNETWSGIHYIKGDFTLKNGSTLIVNNGAIIVEGDVRMDNSAILQINKPVDVNGYPIEGDPFWEKPYAHLAIVATGDIELKNSSTSINGVVQTTKNNGEIGIKNGATIIGAAIATQVTCYNTSSIIYDEKTLGGITTQGDPFYKKISWQEIY